MDDLNRAVDLANIAVDATPHDHPDRAIYLKNLGNRLGARFERTGSMDDIDHALLSYKGGWHCRTASPSIRICSARDAAQILASHLIWEDASILLQKGPPLNNLRTALRNFVSPRLKPSEEQATDKLNMPPSETNTPRTVLEPRFCIQGVPMEAFPASFPNFVNYVVDFLPLPS